MYVHKYISIVLGYSNTIFYVQYNKDWAYNHENISFGNPECWLTNHKKSDVEKGI